MEGMAAAPSLPSPDPSRAPAVVGALRAGTATDLVIDEGTARTIEARARP